MPLVPLVVWDSFWLSLEDQFAEDDNLESIRRGLFELICSPRPFKFPPKPLGVPLCDIRNFEHALIALEGAPRGEPFPFIHYESST